MQAINPVTPDKKGAKLSGRINVGISKTNILFEKNEFKDLRLRSTIGTGVGYQGLQDTEELFVRSHTGFRFPLKNGFLATLQYSYDWYKNPSPGQEDYDAKYMFTLGYEFQ